MIVSVRSWSLRFTTRSGDTVSCVAALADPIGFDLKEESMVETAASILR